MTYTVPITRVPKPPLASGDNLGYGVTRMTEREFAGHLRRDLQAANAPRGLRYAKLVLHWAPAVAAQVRIGGYWPSVSICMDALVERGTVDHRSHLIATAQVEPVARECLAFAVPAGFVHARLWLTIEDLSSPLPGLLLGDQPTPPDAA